MNSKLVPIAIIIVGVFIAGAVYYQNERKCVKVEENKFISSQEAGEKVINFVNQNILRGKATASLISTTKENGLYKIKFSVQDQKVETYLTADGKIFFPEGIDLTEVQPVAVETGLTVGDFSVSQNGICREGEKPIIYFFGSRSCPHCRWEHPIVEEVVSKFGENIVFHNNMDTDKEKDVFKKYSTGGIPTLVLGCKYYRVGSGEGAGKEEEIKALTALICKLTDSKPADVCDQVKELIKQIEK